MKILNSMELSSTLFISLIKLFFTLLFFWRVLEILCDITLPIFRFFWIVFILKGGVRIKVFSWRWIFFWGCQRFFHSTNVRLTRFFLRWSWSSFNIVLIGFSSMIGPFWTLLIVFIVYRYFSLTIFLYRLFFFFAAWFKLIWLVAISFLFVNPWWLSLLHLMMSICSLSKSMRYLFINL